METKNKDGFKAICIQAWNMIQPVAAPIGYFDIVF